MGIRERVKSGEQKALEVMADLVQLGDMGKYVQSSIVSWLMRRMKSKAVKAKDPEPQVELVVVPTNVHPQWFEEVPERYYESPHYKQCLERRRHGH